MRRLFKKYNLLLGLGVILALGFLANSLATLYLSRDALLQQSEKKTLPLIGENMASVIALSLSRSHAISSQLANDVFLRDAILSEDPDTEKVVAYLKSARQKDASLSHFLVIEKDQKYLDSRGTVRTVNQDDFRDEWYAQLRQSDRDHVAQIASDFAEENSPILNLGYPIHDAEHGFAGAVGLSMPMTVLLTTMNDYAKNYGCSIFFVDHNGKIVLSDTRSNKVGNIRQLDGIKLVADDLLNNRQPIQSKSYDKAEARLQLNARYVPELGWYLMVENDTASAVHDVMPLVYTNAVAGTVITLLALLLAGHFIANYQIRMNVLASRDSMTGLMNRQAFTNSFQQAVLEMQRLKLPLSFILFDIDYLKKINESHGHATGDKIITDVARLSKSSVRGSDLLCRWGGEQFALLLKRCDVEQAYKIAEQLRLNVQNHPFTLADRDASVTISLGVAEWTDNESVDDLFARVDEAVYLAKSEGRNRAEISYYVNA